MKRQIQWFAVLTLSLGFGMGLEGLYVLFEVRKVPVARLAANLETQLASDPRNIQTRLNLGRLYGMAYALRSNDVPAATMRRESREEPWYGYEPDHIPYKSDPLKPGETAARGHLDEARKHYSEALKLDPQNLLARLGYGWVLEQAGEKTRAIEEYRAVIAGRGLRRRRLQSARRGRDSSSQ